MFLSSCGPSCGQIASSSVACFNSLPSAGCLSLPPAAKKCKVQFTVQRVDLNRGDSWSRAQCMLFGEQHKVLLEFSDCATGLAQFTGPGTRMFSLEERAGTEVWEWSGGNEFCLDTLPRNELRLKVVAAKRSWWHQSEEVVADCRLRIDEDIFPALRSGHMSGQLATPLVKESRVCGSVTLKFEVSGVDPSLLPNMLIPEPFTTTRKFSGYRELSTPETQVFDDGGGGSAFTGANGGLHLAALQAAAANIQQFSLAWPTSGTEQVSKSPQDIQPPSTSRGLSYNASAGSPARIERSLTPEVIDLPTSREDTSRMPEFPQLKAFAMQHHQEQGGSRSSSPNRPLQIRGAGKAQLPEEAGQLTARPHSPEDKAASSQADPSPSPVPKLRFDEMEAKKARDDYHNRFSWMPYAPRGQSPTRDGIPPVVPLPEPGQASRESAPAGLSREDSRESMCCEELPPPRTVD
eukprot:TRINITY_DN44599_c0_g1_i1.p1 TRINITY_DN44599_c0_g1~~TRINITY_DN44599_c0_g1_i1.p1  ORF type:complete len:463 (-),score=61.89 TRINITY_DN44599_c0_g1_i1:38-1426(-)